MYSAIVSVSVNGTVNSDVLKFRFLLWDSLECPYKNINNYVESVYLVIREEY